jgi:hypothetical protein
MDGVWVVLELIESPDIVWESSFMWGEAEAEAEARHLIGHTKSLKAIHKQDWAA